jgi:hypothetical protein
VRTLDAESRPTKLQNRALFPNLDRNEERARDQISAAESERDSIQKLRKTNATAPNRDGLRSAGDGNELRPGELIQSLSELRQAENDKRSAQELVDGS